MLEVGGAGSSGKQKSVVYVCVCVCVCVFTRFSKLDTCSLPFVSLGNMPCFILPMENKFLLIPKTDCSST